MLLCGNGGRCSSASPCDTEQGPSLLVKSSARPRPWLPTCAPAELPPSASPARVEDEEPCTEMLLRWRAWTPTTLPAIHPSGYVRAETPGWTMAARMASCGHETLGFSCRDVEIARRPCNSGGCSRRVTLRSRAISPSCAAFVRVAACVHGHRGRKSTGKIVPLLTACPARRDIVVDPTASIRVGEPRSRSCTENRNEHDRRHGFGYRRASTGV